MLINLDEDFFEEFRAANVKIEKILITAIITNKNLSEEYLSQKRSFVVDLNSFISVTLDLQDSSTTKLK